jgi:hypothetical protein
MEAATQNPTMEPCLPRDIVDAQPPAIQRDLSLRQRNLSDLQSLQEVILLEEDRALSTEEVLSRVLSFYRRFVPYPQKASESQRKEDLSLYL